MRRPFAAVPALIVAALFALPRPGHADEGDSESHIQQGVELRRTGRNADALVEFQKAYALDPTPRARAQIALALQALGDWLGAEHWLEDALKAENDPWIEQYRTTLVGAMATIGAHLGRLYIETSAKEGEVLVNGASVHALPVGESIPVVPGTLDVVVRATGYQPARRAVEVAAGAEVHVAFELKPVPAERPSGTLAVGLPAEHPVQSDASAARPRSVVGGAVALAAAGALAATGIGAWRINQADVSTFNDNSRCLQAGGGLRGQQCGGYLDSANVALGVEIGTFAAAAVGAAIGTWLLWPRRSATSTRSTALACEPYAGLGLACGGRF
jgi:PEGA domain-containing protein